MGYRLTFHTKNDLGYYSSDRLLKKHGILVVFTTRLAGFSHSPFSSLNLAFHVGDDERHVVKNREKLCRLFNLDHGSLVCAEQVHGIEVADILEKDIGRGAFSTEDSIKGVDALVSSLRTAPLLLLFADCVPVVLVEPEKPVIGVVHAGWRGIYGNILGNTVAAMQSSRSVDPKDLMAFIGPSIGGCCYQVDTRLIRKFSEKFDEDSSWLKADRIDLQELGKFQLLASGISIDNIYRCEDCCTFCRNDVFFSYRGDGCRTGRHGAMAAVLDKNHLTDSETWI